MTQINFLDQLLEEQADLTAVERFSKVHDEMDELGKPALESNYKALIPSRNPKEGEQYSFEVNLDACTGCKACVVGCHHMNGLAEAETWREVNTLKSGEEGKANVQHLTSACHHCLEPGCATGCPVQAYEKDESTGVVYHLDDQCIGCRYCELKCPYEVPQFNETLGIVRKCDMCIGRLKEGEAPACVQSCPNEAIEIKLVNKEEIRSESGSGRSLPGNPSSDYTSPTTRYVGQESQTWARTERKPQLAHGHLPLATMLPLTQLGFGMLVASGFAGAHSSVFGWLILMAGLAVAPLHLGRPQLAWKAFLGARTSWLSREMLAFGPFAGLASLWMAFEIAPYLGLGEMVDSFFWVEMPLFIGMLLTGIASVFCSAMIYVDTPRPLWKYGGTFQRFSGSVLLGAAAGLSSAVDLTLAYGCFVVALGLKVYGETGVFRNLRAHPELEETVTLIRSHLLGRQKLRWVAYVVVALFVPLVSLMFTIPLLLIMLWVEVDERHDFFRAGIAPGEMRNSGHN